MFYTLRSGLQRYSHFTCCGKKATWHGLLCWTTEALDKGSIRRISADKGPACLARGDIPIEWCSTFKMMVLYVWPCAIACRTSYVAHPRSAVQSLQTYALPAHMISLPTTPSSKHFHAAKNFFLLLEAMPGVPTPSHLRNNGLYWHVRPPQ